jgi:hypothetical protein
MLLKAIKEFDEFLLHKGLKFEAIIIGGAALTILNVITRMTEDVDCIDPEIPLEIKNASIDFIKQNPHYGLVPEKFLNNGPITITKDLPEDWKIRTQIIFQGKALTFLTLSRLDLLKTKLDAMVHRGRDIDDVVAMKPTEEELEASLEWVLNVDGGVYWPEMVKNAFEILRKKLNGKS